MVHKPTPAFALALASISLIGPLAIHIFLPVIPAVKADFAISESLAQATFSVGLFGMAFSTLVYGTLSDRYGRRPVLLFGLALFVCGSAICALAGSLPALLAGRLLQSVGAGCGITLVRTIARDAYGQENLVRAIAYLTMFYTMGPMFAPLIGGIILDAFDWPVVFVFSLAAGLAIALAAYLAIPETRPAGPPAAAGSSFLADFVALFSHLRFSAFVLQTGFNTGVFFTVGSAAAVIMKEALGRSATEYGLYFIMFPAGFFVGNLVTSRLTRRVSIEAMVLAGSLVTFAATLALAALLLAGHLSPLVLFVPGFIITFAQGIALPSGQAGAMGTIPRLAGTAAGIGVFVQNFCGAAIAQVYGQLADGTVMPLVLTTLVCATLGLCAGAIPLAQANRRPLKGSRLPR